MSGWCHALFFIFSMCMKTLITWGDRKLNLKFVWNSEIVILIIWKIKWSHAQFKLKTNQFSFFKYLENEFSSCPISAQKQLIVVLDLLPRKWSNKKGFCKLQNADFMQRKKSTKMIILTHREIISHFLHCTQSFLLYKTIGGRGEVSIISFVCPYKGLNFW